MHLEIYPNCALCVVGKLAQCFSGRSTIGTFSVGDMGGSSTPWDRPVTAPSSGGDWAVRTVLEANP